MKPAAILETILYAADLGAAEAFYRDTLGLEPIAKVPGRHIFFRLSDQMFLLFNPAATVIAPPPDATLPVPRHGAVGPGHVCFRATAGQIRDWRRLLEANGVAIEADFEWPGGGRSIYFRDPAGNCIEFAEPRIWSLPE